MIFSDRLLVVTAEPYPETLYDRQSAISLGKYPSPMGTEVAKL